MALILTELALNYQVRPFTNRANPVSETSIKVFPIERCIPDILVAIFQTLVDDEAAGIDPRFSARTIKRQATARLALVCKGWKEIVYNAPSLWNLITIDAHVYVNNLSTTSLPMRLVRMAKGAPVDLYIFGFPADYSDESVITTLLTTVPNLRKLRVELVTSASQETYLSPPLLLSRDWPALLSLRELSYFTPPLTTLRADLTAHLLGMPYLVSLWLNQPRFSVPYCDEPGDPLLPRLKILSLQGSFITNGTMAASMTSAFLSHCPKIEELDLTIMDPHNPIPIEDSSSESPKLTLAHLRKLKSSGTVALTPFVSSKIVTPALNDVALFNYSDTFTSSLSHLFTKNTKTLTSLFLSVTDDAHFYRALLPLVQLTSLSLLATGQGTFLVPLCEEEVLPSLRFFKLSMNRSSLSASHFTKFVRARCIPVTINPNAQRITAVGYSALENFVLIALNVPMVLKHVRETQEWQSAKLNKATPCVFEMWWQIQSMEGRPRNFN